MTSPTTEDWKKMWTLVETFASRADTEPFRTPVPWKELGLMDYLEVIKAPMDFGTVKHKLKKKEYKTLFEVGNDVRLIWNNCMTYNQDGSDFFTLAASLSRRWDKASSKLMGDMVPTNTTNTAAAEESGATAEEGSNAAQVNNHRYMFAKSLHDIAKKEDVGKVLVELESKCPAAITHYGQEDMELNVDKIPPALLVELGDFVSRFPVSSKASKKKASSETK